MSEKKHTAEQIMGKLREAEIGLVHGATVEACKRIGLTVQTHYWRLPMSSCSFLSSVSSPPTAGTSCLNCLDCNTPNVPYC